MKKGSIYKKIQKQILFGTAAATLSLCIAAIVCIMVMRGSIITSGEGLGTSAADDSKIALESQMQSSLLRLAQNMAVISDEKLASTAGLVRMLSENATAVASNPGRYTPNIPGFPDPANAGIIVSQLRLPEDIDFDAVEDEIGLLGNLSDLLVSQMRFVNHVGSAYIGSERGVSISTDVHSDIKTNVFDPRIREWYIRAMEAGGLIWTDVFADNSGRGLSISCAMPFYDADGQMAGVAGAGMLLDVLDGIVLDTSFGETGYAFIVGQRGELIISDMVTIEGAVIHSPNLSDFLPDETAARIMGGHEGIERVSIDDTEYFIAYAPLGTLPWSLSVVMSVDEVIAPAIENERHILGMTSDTLRDLNRIILISVSVFAAAFVLTLFGNTVLARRMAANLAKPIMDLSRGAEIIGAGDLEHRLNVKTGDELEALGDTFNAMIANIKTITSEKERIGAELDVASGIQANMLPRIFPAFPERMEFDLFASMSPAKEVGGDFYDFFMVDPNTLAVVIADVSDKGVPAALFMVIAKAMIKSNAQSGKNPKEVFEIVNNLLCENNDAGMFVTAILGYLDIPSGKFSFVNAGHNPPLLRTNTGYDWLKKTPSLVLAGMEDMLYREYETTLRPGDELFLYTDGLTEAMNHEREMFGDARLLDCVNKHLALPLGEFGTSVKEEIDEFCSGADQTDDMTVLILRIMHVENAENEHAEDSQNALAQHAEHTTSSADELVIGASLENTDIVLDFLSERLGDCDLKIKNQIKIVADEIFSNIARYAYKETPGDATVRIFTGGAETVPASDEKADLNPQPDQDGGGHVITIEFEDSGVAYNPLLKEDPDITLSAEDRDVGGLGIFMVKKIMDLVEYRRLGDKNILTLTKKTR
ncbi:MAG: SpoIIE family protein phosphatase [Oscillospiraceae bacterium]|nr:SpoIIE family protein phosphatase [Oscillospiraceae bacterium]